MKYLLTILTVAILAILILTAHWGAGRLPLSNDTTMTSISDSDKYDTTIYVDSTEWDEEMEFAIDTVMNAKGDAFGYLGDISMWGGWFLDSICVGHDNMLRYDSIGPSTLRLSLLSKDLTVDLGDEYAAEKIKEFMGPRNGFKRHRIKYKKVLDSVYHESHCYGEIIGIFTFDVDYPSGGQADAEKINRFICRLGERSEIESCDVPAVSAFYAGFNPVRSYRPAFTGDVNDIPGFSYFLAHRTFENWIRGGDIELGDDEAVLTLRPWAVTDAFVTYGKYEYNRVGIGHGMYTETFHTLDLQTGVPLTNSHIFKPGTLDQVKRCLFEVMAKDSHYLEWNEGIEAPSEIEAHIAAWREPSPFLEGTEWEEPESDRSFQLPAGALTEKGVLFSFQPYEIDCWAAGTFHFTVPYSCLTSYLTPKVKGMIRNLSPL